MKHLKRALSYFLFPVLIQIVVGILYSLFFMVKLGTKEFETLDPLIDERNFGIVILSSILTLVGMISYFNKTGRNFAKTIKLKKPETKDSPATFLMLFFFSLAFLYTMDFFQPGSAESLVQVSRDHYNEFFPGFGWFMQILAILIFAPISEEVISRGLVLNTLKLDFSPNTSRLISATLFGLLHLPMGIPMGIGGFFVGLLFGIIYSRSESILSVILAHSVANLADFAYFFIPKGTGLNWLFFGLSFLAFILSGYFYFKPNKK